MSVRKTRNARRKTRLACGFWRSAFGVLALLLAFSLPALAQARTDLKGIVPGDELGWERSELEAAVLVSKATILNLQIYSPGFDPKDYRSSLKGFPELGDERYDKGKGRIRSEFVLLQGGKELARQSFGVEPHRWVLFFRGQVQPGVYQVKARLYGLAKNAFRYRIQTSVPQAASLVVEPGLQLYDIRPTDYYNVRSRQWVEPLVLEVAPEVLPLKVSFYDEDGPGELEGRVRYEGGKTQSRPVSGDRSWADFELTRPGRVVFGFRQPPTAKQYSNTIGFRVEGCIQVDDPLRDGASSVHRVERDFLRVVPPRPVQVSVVDERGEPLAVEVPLEGRLIRSVRLRELPEGYRLKAVQAEGAEALADGGLRFGCAGGSVRFVLERLAQPAPKSDGAKTPPPPAPARLELSAVLVTPAGERPYDLSLRVGESRVQLAEGRAALELAAGSYALEHRLAGARVEGPERVALEPGQSAQARYRVTPEVALTFESDRATMQVGEEAVLTARVSTAFPELLPADLRLELPDCLEPQQSPRLSSPVSASRSVTLRLSVKAVCKGEFAPVAHLAPWGQSRQVSLRVLQPATFTLHKTGPEAAAVGERVTYRLRVGNSGDVAGTVRLRDVLPEGLEGEGLEQTLTLQPGQSQTLELAARLTPQAGATLTNRAVLLSASGQELATAQSTLRVLRPKAELSRGLDYRKVLPGEVVTVSLRVHNGGEAPLDYALTDAYPEWLEPLEKPEFAGHLEPGAERLHTYRARVAFGAPAEGLFRAELRSNGGSLSASDRLERVLIGVNKRAERERVVLGSSVAFVIELHNPADHTVRFELQDIPGEGLEMAELPQGQIPFGTAKPYAWEFVLEPGQRTLVRLEGKPARVGSLENQALAFAGGVPVSFPSKAAVAVLPVLEPVRSSTIRLEFTAGAGVDPAAPRGERLLITHLPPSEAAGEGKALRALYEPGSARLDGNPLPDPRVDEEGRLYFEIPYQPGGVLSYQVRHRAALGGLEAPTLTLGVADREVLLQGQVSFAALAKTRPLEPKARQGFIQEPLPGTVFRVDRARVVLEMPYGLEFELRVGGEPVTRASLGKAEYDSAKGTQRLEYYGLPLHPGANLIEFDSPAGSDRVEVFLAGKPTRLVARPLKLYADGRTPLELELLALDASGLPSGFGPLTLASSLEPLDPDAFPTAPGYQLLLRDGRAVLRLKPLALPGNLRLELAFDELEGRAEFFVPGRQNTLWQAQGSVGASFGGGVGLFGVGRGYLETPLDLGGEGTLRVALDARFGLRGLEGGLNPTPDPNTAFPLTGSGTEAVLPLRSADPLALRYDNTAFSLGYHAEALALPGLSSLGEGTALRFETREAQGFGVTAFAGLLPQATLTEEPVLDGTRRYKLAQPPVLGSESVLLREGASERRLERGQDYTLDADGWLTLAKPLWPTTPAGEPVVLQVTYAAQNSPRAPGWGFGLRYRQGGFSAGASLAALPAQDLRYGAELGWREGHFSLRASYARQNAERFGLELGYAGTPFEARADLSYEGRLQGSASLGLAISPADKLALEHQAADQNRTALLYQRQLGPGFSLGGGLSYLWDTAGLGAVGRLSYGEAPWKLELTHTQPFRFSDMALSQLKMAYAFDFNLAAEAALDYLWGNDLRGSLALKQKLGDANLSLSYQLPGASGEGNRARFGLEAPLPLDERWSLDLSAGYDRSLGTGTDQAAFGVALRYKDEGLSGTLGGELAFGASPKLVLRGGLTGALDAEQTLSLDANYQALPAPDGKFTLAYALRSRQLQLLTYYRLSVGQPGWGLEGALAAGYQPDLSWQLRPSAAYRLPAGDPGGATYQLGLDGNHYFTDSLGFGVAVYQLFQPATASSATHFGLEGSLRVLEGLWVNLGYTFGYMSALTPDAQPGFYLRLDFFGGGR
ncbi:DUF11 domain-containing protein [Calidithermus timidus]|uniref:DUF11 domain-containing protein n=1 Tax=Calidithermus timidus TaxID=307124 RepID=UPI00037B765B|nr:DUF11 domain-containing protein [Calidithermus timidus]